VSFSPDGLRLAAGGYDGSIIIWDLASRQQVARWKPSAFSACVCFLEEEGDLLSATDKWWDIRETRLWRAASLAEIDALEQGKNKER
jgi:WD40 repeat protein